jgi:hypothetical protein
MGIYVIQEYRHDHLMTCTASANTLEPQLADELITLLHVSNQEVAGPDGLLLDVGCHHVEVGTGKNER